jgi:hypothetical protein
LVINLIFSKIDYTISTDMPCLTPATSFAPISKGLDLAVNLDGFDVLIRLQCGDSTTVKGNSVWGAE